MQLSVTSSFAYRTVAVVIVYGFFAHKKKPNRKIKSYSIELNRTIVCSSTASGKRQQSTRDMPKIHREKFSIDPTWTQEKYSMESGKWALKSEWLMEILVCQIMKLKVEKNFNYAPRGPLCVWWICCCCCCRLSFFSFLLNHSMLIKSNFNLLNNFFHPFSLATVCCVREHSTDLIFFSSIASRKCVRAWNFSIFARWLFVRIFTSVNVAGKI